MNKAKSRMQNLKRASAKFFSFLRGRMIIPWLQKVLKQNWKIVQTEISQSEEMLMILWKYAHGQKVTAQEKKMATQQLLTIVRLIPALAIFLLPGGMLLLPLLARALPWDILPVSFRKKN